MAKIYPTNFIEIFQIFVKTAVKNFPKDVKNFSNILLKHRENVPKMSSEVLPKFSYFSEIQGLSKFSYKNR